MYFEYKWAIRCRDKYLPCLSSRRTWEVEKRSSFFWTFNKMPFPLTLEFCSPPSISSHSRPTISCYCLIRKGSAAIFFITLSIFPRANLSDHKSCALTLLWQLLLMVINNNHCFDLLDTFLLFIFHPVVAALRSIISSFLIFVTQIKNSLFLPCPFFPVMGIKLIYSLLRVNEELWCPTFLWMTVILLILFYWFIGSIL